MIVWLYEDYGSANLADDDCRECIEPRESAAGQHVMAPNRILNFSIAQDCVSVMQFPYRYYKRTYAVKLKFSKREIAKTV